MPGQGSQSEQIQISSFSASPSINVCFKYVSKHVVLLHDFLRAVDEELEKKPKKKRKRTRELPKEDSSDDGNIPPEIDT